MSTAANRDIHPIAFGIGFYLHTVELFFKHPRAQWNQTQALKPFLFFQQLLLLEWGLELAEADQARALTAELLAQETLLPWRIRYQERALAFCRAEPARATMWLRHALALVALQSLYLQGEIDIPVAQATVLEHWRQRLRVTDEGLYQQIIAQGFGQGLAAYVLIMEGKA